VNNGRMNERTADERERERKGNEMMRERGERRETKGALLDMVKRDIPLSRHPHPSRRHSHCAIGHAASQWATTDCTSGDRVSEEREYTTQFTLRTGRISLLEGSTLRNVTP